MEISEKWKFSSLRAPTRKRREILWWVIKGEMMATHRGPFRQQVADGLFWPCFSRPKLGDAARTRIASKIMEEVHNTFFNTLEPLWKSDLHCTFFSATSATASYIHTYIFRVFANDRGKPIQPQQDDIYLTSSSKNFVGKIAAFLENKCFDMTECGWMLRFCFSSESGGWCFGERFGDPQGCPFGSMLDNNTYTEKYL